MRKTLMLATIKALKELKLDIRAFNVLQLQQLINLVAHHVPEELGVFYKFIETAAGQGIFNNHFEPLARLFYLFVEQGYLQSQTTLYYITMLALKKEVLGDKGISPDFLINLTWSLVAMEGT